MMFSFFQRKASLDPLVSSKLFNEYTFYEAFMQDLENCKEEVVIESPYITNSRMWPLRPIFQKLVDRNVTVYIITRDPKEHEENLAVQAEGQISEFEIMGVQVLLSEGNHHRKLAMLDRKILWEGSLNILSQVKSREIMRRIESKKLTLEMLKFLKLEKVL